MTRVFFGLGLFLVPSFAAAAPPGGADDHLALAARIDARVEARWPRTGFVPAPAADDAEFLRRVCLDVAGVIPYAFEARDFLDDPSPQKRRRLVDRLLAGPDHVRHFAAVWRRSLLEGAAGVDRQSAASLEAWLAKHLRDGAGYDRIVRELLAAPLEGGRRRPGAPEPGAPSPPGSMSASPPTGRPPRSSRPRPRTTPSSCAASASTSSAASRPSPRRASSSTTKAPTSGAGSWTSCSTSRAT